MMDGNVAAKFQARQQGKLPGEIGMQWDEVANGRVFFFNDTATTEIYTLSLHDALPISAWTPRASSGAPATAPSRSRCRPDRKSTRLNSSHVRISYAVFCLKKKNHQTKKPLHRKKKKKKNKTT